MRKSIQISFIDVHIIDVNIPFIFSCKNTKIAIYCWITINGRMLDPNKKRYPMSKDKEEALTRWSVQFTSVAQSCPTLCDPMNRSTPGLPVHHQPRSSLRLTSIMSVMPSSHLILCGSLLLLPPIPPSIRVFSNESTLPWGGQSTGVSALASFLPKKFQGRSPSEWTGWISLQSKGLSRVFSNTTVQKHQFFSAQPSSQSNSLIHTWPQEKP